MTRPYPMLLVLPMVACALLTPRLAPGQSLQMTAGDAGPAMLHWQDSAFALPAALDVTRVTTGDPSVAATTDIAAADLPLDGARREVSDGGRRIVTTYRWGSVACFYELSGDRLQIALTIENRGDRPIVDFSAQLLQLTLPATPEGWDKPRRRVARSLDNLAMHKLTVGDARLIACIDTLYPPLALTLEAPAGAAPLTVPVVLSAGVPTVDPDAPRVAPRGLWVVPPGQSKTAVVSLRFAAAGTPDAQVLGDLYAGFRELYPAPPRWPDRRPIGMLMLPSGGAGKSPTNPRGWFKKKDLDVTTDAGRAQFRAEMLAWADRAVKSMQAFDAQGGIVWNVEGEENPHPITYIGDPRMLPTFAPEMDAVADEFFQKFRDAGLRTGVTIRPTQVYLKGEKWAHGTGSQMAARNPLEEDYASVHPEGLAEWGFFPTAERLSRKIEYAQRRWGCTIFYIDTNGIFAPVEAGKDFKWMLIAGSVLRELRERHPDVLIIPELMRDDFTWRLTNYAYAAPYMELDLKGYGTPAAVRDIYPDAFSVVNIADGPIEEQRGVLVEAVRRGDILMTRGWFGDHRNAIVKSIYDEAGR